MNLLIWTLIFIAALAVLVKSAHFFAQKSEALGKQWGLSPFLTGLTLVALGTSLPELATSLVATAKDFSSLVPAIAVGSNLVNFLLVGGAAAFLTKSPINVAALIALLIVTLYDGTFTWLEGLILIAAQGIFLAQYWNKKDWKAASAEKLWPWVLLSVLGMILGAKFTVDGVMELSQSLNLDSSVLALSAVALGAALPEFLVVLQALRTKNSELALGTLLGSIAFNSTLVLALPSLMGPLNVTHQVIGLALPFLIIALLLMAFQVQQRTLFALIYFVFIGQLFHFL